MSSSKLTNPQQAILAIARRGGDMDYVDVEDIAVELETLAPGRFSWRKYPDRIDLDSVRVACRDAKKTKNGGMLMGDNVTGWMLTEEGRQWLESRSDLSNKDVARPRRDSTEALLEDERQRLRQTEAYKLFVSDRAEQIAQLDYFQFARINEYFNETSRQRRFAMIETAISTDPALVTLWAYLVRRFQKES